MREHTWKGSNFIAGTLAFFLLCPEVHAQWANAAARKENASSSRSLEEIQLVFDRGKHAFEELFYKAGLNAGRIVVGFTIAPDGTVTHCYVASSSYEDPSFENAVLSEVRKLKFGARNVPEFTYTNFPIVLSHAFGPLPPA